MKPTTRVRIPRLYTFIILIAILFSVVNIIVLYYAENLVLYIGAVWGWISLLIMSLIGTLLIGMYIAYRLLAMRSFTPFEREMMEMRVEVAHIKRSSEEIRARLDAMGAPAGAGAGDAARPHGHDERELLAQLRAAEERLRNTERMLQEREAELERARLVKAERKG